MQSPSSEVTRLRLLNVLASLAVIASACAIYVGSPFNASQLSARYGPPALSFGGLEFLLAAAGTYAALLVLYYWLEPEPSASKSLRCLRTLASFARDPRGAWRRGLTADERVAILATLLKMFFAPMMTMSLMIFCVSAWINGTRLLAAGIPQGGFRLVFDRFGYWFLMQLILFVDVLVFTIGYLVESRRLGNEIRSVDPTLLGWAFALVCYPPFNLVTRMILGAQVSDFPRFDDPTLHLALNLTLLTLMAIYASASVALGWKASNLTHRGIVERGPYAVVRHPAYVSKNMAWWIGASPLVVAAFERSPSEGLAALGSVVAWTAIYFMRALTEEDHLRGVDGEYAAYAARVRYRFLPGIC